ncbi:hypothetical protein Ppb6_02805 [Photorhabdus australis subsp. thailandensis]|uniref:Uncharacterized protein n=1 Tax=Photorhabdus australis subsp. thailandensis TaxID=2805096 RepID=A0A1C0U288_9GAMM|nr:hypothetical protein [Photorhabdus australis]OCQ52011.1 hypothetical protein Ppb6_02805 [Photorhabdus australis subsp. thailandensis]
MNNLNKLLSIILFIVSSVTHASMGKTECFKGVVISINNDYKDDKEVKKEKKEYNGVAFKIKENDSKVKEFGLRSTIDSPDAKMSLQLLTISFLTGATVTGHSNNSCNIEGNNDRYQVEQIRLFW